MSRWRIVVIALLTLLPFAALAGVGTYYLWTTGIGFYTWWVLFACLSVGYLLGWYWQRKQQLLRPVEFRPPAAGTEADASPVAIDADYLGKGRASAPTPGPFEKPGTGPLDLKVW